MLAHARLLRGWGCVALVFALTSVTARAQEAPAPPDAVWPDYAKRISLPERGAAPLFIATTNGLPNVLLTGYWPPTNEMLRQFSRNIDQNSNGWVGENWEGRGYNVYAYFPEFPAGFGQGEGDFEIDYQDTSNDWWSLLPQINPIAIITFSRASNDLNWEPEGGNRTYAAAQWTADDEDPFRPDDPALPIVSEPPLTERYSTLPIAQIMANVAGSGAAVTLLASVLDNGRYLSNYIGYHGCWYHDLHADPVDPNWVACAGHVHVGYAMTLEAAVQATEVTVRTVLAHVDERRALLTLGDLNGDGSIDLGDHLLLEACMNGPVDNVPPPSCDSIERFMLADRNADGFVDLVDYGIFAKNLIDGAPPALALPVADSFASTTFDPALWELVASATIDDVGLAEPSAPYAARLNKLPTVGDKFESRPIDTRSSTPVHLQYAWQRRGGGESPEATDDLLVEFKDARGQWQTLAVHLGDGVDMTIFQLEDIVLPASALHHQFRLRFRSAFGLGAFGDDWFVDDVAIFAE